VVDKGVSENLSSPIQRIFYVNREGKGWSSQNILSPFLWLDR